MENIQMKCAIWDMHVHTCDCPKASNEFKLLNRKEFIEKIIKIFDTNE